MTTVGIIQPNFIPWRGYFDFIKNVDLFVFLDDVQYTKRDWRNRNRIRTKSGESRWLSVPVNCSRDKKILDAKIDTTSDWQRNHLAVLSENYADSPYLGLVKKRLTEAYDRHTFLSDMNIDLTKSFMKFLGIDTEVLVSSELGVDGVKSERLVGITKKVGGDHYLAGPTSKQYVDLDYWRASGVKITFKNYPDYRAYDQIAQPYDPYVSIIDLILMTGEDARHYLS